jgi:hypothetical protein
METQLNNWGQGKNGGSATIGVRVKMVVEPNNWGQGKNGG